MKKIGILYICTGAYAAFWKEFYESFQKHFLTGYEKHYFVFTDVEEVYGYRKNPNIHLHKIVNLPWPLITLFRFHFFLSIEEELQQMDYLVFSNANMRCVEDIMSEDFLPRKEKGERLFAAIHPGYEAQKGIYAPYERSKKSKAYVPYNCGKKYVIGAMNGGETNAFLDMCHVLSKAIDDDLKNNIIAKWHDESHLNHYVSSRNDFRILSSEYCYPWGMKVAYQSKIEAVSKQEKFDVKSFKGVRENQKGLKRIVQFIKNGVSTYIVSWGRFIIDVILCRKIRDYQ